MPVDDLLVWAAETSRDNVKAPKTKASPDPAEESESFLKHDAVTGPVSAPLSAPLSAPPSAPPSKPIGLPKWYDIGHCPTACSYRCSLHSSQINHHPPPSQVAANNAAGLEAKHHKQAHQQHGANLPSFQRDGSQTRHRSSLQKPPNRSSSSGYHRKSRLDQAREALMMGDVEVARAIVTEETERLCKVETKA